MAFDFSSYLARLDPAETYSVKLLTGGVVNVTARATKTNVDGEVGGRFPEHKTLVLKQAPPYVASVGESAPMSQFRQEIEARALSLFLPDSPHTLHHICESTGVRVPKLLHYDSTAHVLVLSDLGAYPNLSDLFSSVGGYTPGNIPSPAAADSPSSVGSSPKPLSYYTLMGTELGVFFAKLHSPQTLSQVTAGHSNPSTMSMSASLSSSTATCVTDPPTFLTNPTTAAAILTSAIKPIQTRLQLFPHLFHSPSEAIELYSLIEENFLASTPFPTETSLVLGDCWPGAVLVGPGSTHDTSPPDITQIQHPTTSATTPSIDLSVIDWEFSALLRGPHGDMAQLLAHLQLFQLAAEWRRGVSPSAGTTSSALHTLTAALTRAYHAQSVREGALWAVATPSPVVAAAATTGSVSGDENAEAIRTRATLARKLLRSARIAHAAELVNAAFWKVWVCGEVGCPAGGGGGGGAGAGAGTEVGEGGADEEEGDGDDDARKATCGLVSAMVEKAVRYLRLAAREGREDDADNEGERKEDVRQGEKGEGDEWIMKSLFFPPPETTAASGVCGA